MEDTTSNNTGEFSGAKSILTQFFYERSHHSYKLYKTHYKLTINAWGHNLVKVTWLKGGFNHPLRLCPKNFSGPSVTQER